MPFKPSSSYKSRDSHSGPRSRSEGRGGPGQGHHQRDDRRGGGAFRLRKKPNRYYLVFPDKNAGVDFKDTEKLTKFLTEKGKIIPRRITGLTSKQQRVLARAIKRARHAGLIAFQAD